jgi:hypothetical protein
VILDLKEKRASREKKEIRARMEKTVKMVLTEIMENAAQLVFLDLQGEMDKTERWEKEALVDILVTLRDSLDGTTSVPPSIS